MPNQIKVELSNEAFLKLLQVTGTKMAFRYTQPGGAETYWCLAPQGGLTLIASTQATEQIMSDPVLGRMCWQQAYNQTRSQILAWRIDDQGNIYYLAEKKLDFIRELRALGVSDDVVKRFSVLKTTDLREIADVTPIDADETQQSTQVNVSTSGNVIRVTTKHKMIPDVTVTVGRDQYRQQVSLKIQAPVRGWLEEMNAAFEKQVMANKEISLFDGILNLS